MAKQPLSPWGRGLTLLGILAWVIGTVAAGQGEEGSNNLVPAALTAGLFLILYGHTWGFRRRIEELEDWIRVLEKSQRPTEKA